MKPDRRQLVEVMQEILTEYQGFLSGDIITYIGKYKDWASIEDLKSARNYLNIIIKGRE